MHVIVRHEKHSSLGTIGAAASHTMRTRETPNARPGGPAPEVWLGSQDPLADVRQLLPKKRRKNAVLALEYLVTASPEFFEKQPKAVWKKYLEDQVEMLGKYYGHGNIASVVLHQDEKTPHLAIQIVPLVNGKLNARALIGTRTACAIIQDMAGEVGAAYGLERGKPGSKARHKDVDTWYGELEPKIKKARKLIEEMEKKACELDARERDLEQREAAVQAREQQVAEREAALASREAALTTVEQERVQQRAAQAADLARRTTGLLRGPGPAPGRPPKPRQKP